MISKKTIIALILILVLISLGVLIYIAYTFTSCYQETITVSVPLTNTQRYINGKLFKMDKVIVTITGKISKDQGKIITDRDLVSLIKTNFNKYQGNIIVQDYLLFDNEEIIDKFPESKLIPISVIPSLENLSILLFEELNHNLTHQRLQLVSITLFHKDFQVTRSRYKASHYTI